MKKINQEIFVKQTREHADHFLTEILKLTNKKFYNLFK